MLIKSREDRVRRILKKRGFRLRKTPSRSWMRTVYSVGYTITVNGIDVLGTTHRGFEASLEDVETFVERLI